LDSLQVAGARDTEGMDTTGGNERACCSSGGNKETRSLFLRTTEEYGKGTKETQVESDKKRWLTKVRVPMGKMYDIPSRGKKGQAGGGRGEITAQARKLGGEVKQVFGLRSDQTLRVNEETPAYPILRKTLRERSSEGERK